MSFPRLAFAFLCVLSLLACSDARRFHAPVYELPASPEGPDGYGPIERYAAMDIPETNPLTPQKAALGWQLYYDPRLSGDGIRSCYSCHVCEKGLTDGLPTAIGAFDKPLPRSSPTMWNIGYHHNWYWDGRAGTLEGQAKAAWTGANMGASEPQQIVDTLNALDGYRTQFEQVFGEPATVDNVPMALAAYMRTIISDDTPWDRWQKGDENAMSEEAKRGWEVFQQAGCIECHAGVLFTDLQFHNVGIGMDGAEAKDEGRGKITGNPQDKGAFKTPTLRDITRSAPYFHDGSIATLEEAVRFMAGGGHPNPALSPKLKPANLSDAQIADLIVFLHALEQPCEENRPRLP